MGGNLQDYFLEQWLPRDLSSQCGCQFTSLLQRLRGAYYMVPCSSNTNLLFLNPLSANTQPQGIITPSVDITLCHRPFPLPLPLQYNRRCQHSAVRRSCISKQVIVIITVNPFISLNTHTKAPLVRKCLRDRKVRGTGMKLTPPKPEPACVANDKNWLVVSLCRPWARMWTKD